MTSEDRVEQPNLRSVTVHSFDEQGREYDPQTIKVTPSTGGLSNPPLTVIDNYDAQGREISTASDH